MDNARRQELGEKLTAKGAQLPCARCGNKDFLVMDGYAMLSVQAETSGFNFGGKGIPSVITICANCGWLALHALGALESLPPTAPGSPQPTEPPK